MRRAVCFIICSCIAFSLLGKDDLENTLQNAKSDSDKLTAYENILKHFQFSNRDSVIYYLQQGIKEFSDSKYYEGKAKMIAALGGKYVENGLMAESRAKENEALEIFTAIHDDNGVATVHNWLGVIDGKTGNYKDAAQHFITALKLFEKTSNIKGQTEAYLKLGTVNEYTTGFSYALANYQKALELAEKSKDTINIINIYNNIGVLYGRHHDSTLAAASLQKALDICTSFPQSAYIRVSPLTNMGNVYDNMNEDAKALDYYHQALVIARRENMPENCIRLIMNIASINVSKNPKAALDSLSMALQMARVIDQKVLATEIMGAMEDIYYHEKDYEKAYYILHKEKALQDSIFSINETKEIAGIQSVYELDKANEKMALLKITSHRERIQRNALIVFVLELLFVIGLLSFFIRNTRKLNRTLKTRKKELEKANKIKDRLFSIIGHDLRNAVATIPSIVTIYEAAETTEEERTFMLRELRDNAEATLGTLDKLLNWGKMMIQGVTTSQAKYKPNENLQNDFILLRSAADKKQITINNNIPDGVTVLADPEHFKFIFRNLVSNAIKFSYSGQSINISADTNSCTGYVVFSVTDTGTGMDEEQKARLFEPHHKSMPGTANESGNGIGLMLCLEFVQENEGSIWVKSEKGKGTTFYFSLKKG